MKTAVRFALGAVAVAAVLAGPLSAQQAAQEPARIKGEVKQAVAVLGPDGIQRVEILGGGYFYDPNHVIVKFTPTKVGTYPFYCTKKMIFTSSHRDKGMKGILEVQ